MNALSAIDASLPLETPLSNAINGQPLTWMPTPWAYGIAALVAFGLAYRATRHCEHPWARWLKVLATVGLVHLVLKAMGHFQAVQSPTFVGNADKQAYGEAVEMLLVACLGAVSTYIHLNPARGRLIHLGRQRLNAHCWSSFIRRN